MKMRLYLTSGLAGFAIAMGWMAGCEHTSGPIAPAVGVGQALTAVALTIRGNGALTAPGQTTQLSAEVTYTDGSKKDVSSTAQWSSSDRSIATVSPTGLVTAVDLGRTRIFAYAPGGGRTSDSLAITVLPVGTYILAGLVTEAGSVPVAGVRVETIGGPMSGRTAVTDQYGRYAIKGVTGVLQVQMTKDGYVAATQSVSQDTENMNVQLTPTVAYAAIGGVYRLTFKAADSCQLPNDAVSRTYTATITEMGARLTIMLSDAQFYQAGSLTRNWFDGRVYGNTVSLTLNSDYYCFYYGNCVAEKLADMRYLTLVGTAAGTATGATISTLFAGSVSVLASPTNTSKPIATCAAPDHQLIFTRTATTTSRKRF